MALVSSFLYACVNIKEKKGENTEETIFRLPVAVIVMARARQCRRSKTKKTSHANVKKV